jgi:sugar lactone lactonase YvrE
LGYSGGGLNGPYSLAIDHNNEAWASNLGAIALSHFSSTGSALSGASGYSGGGLDYSVGVAIDGAGTIWVADGADDDSIQRLSQFKSTGAAITPSTGYSTGGPGAPQTIAIDGSGNVWTKSGTVVSEMVGAATPVVTPLSAGVANNTLGTRP